MTARQSGRARDALVDRLAANDYAALLDLQILELHRRLALIALEAQECDGMTLMAIPVDLDAVVLDDLRQVIQECLGADRKGTGLKAEQFHPYHVGLARQPD